MVRKVDVQMTIRVPRDMKNGIDKAAEKRGCSNTAFVRYCIIKTLESINRGE